MGDMDSPNSGSIQSSSTGGDGGGDDQELESRGESMPSFMNPTTMAPFQLYSFNNGSFSFDHHQQHHQVPSYNFDPTTFSQSSPGNFMLNNNNNNDNNHNISSSNNSDGTNNNLDVVWPNKFGLIRPSISTTPHVANSTTGPCYTHLTTTDANQPQPQPQQQRPPPLPLPTTRAPSVSAENSPRLSENQRSGGGRNSKKRSRASRRAPTTVLTTDTSNFRQMVQEFTGIPAPPFSSSGGFPTRMRLDLFGGMGIQLPRTGAVGGVGGAHSYGAGLDMSMSGSGMQPPPYLLRPSPHKVLPHIVPTHVQPFGATSSMSSTTNPVGNTSTTPVSFHQLTPQNPLHAFQALLQSSSAAGVENYTLPVMQQDPSTSPKSKPAAQSFTNEFELSHNNACTSGTATTATTRTSATAPAGSTAEQTWSALRQEHLPLHTQTSCSAKDGGNYNSIGTTMATVNGVPSANHVGVTKGEGNVESWICSSSD